MNELRTVLEAFVFPSKHLPNCFNNNNLVNELDSIYSEYGSVESLLEDCFIIENNTIKTFDGYTDKIMGIKKGVEPLHFNISKPNGANRTMSIVNPVVLIPLHFYINKYNEEILKEQFKDEENYSSSSRFHYDEGNFIRYVDYDGNPIEETYANVSQSTYQESLLNKQKICDGKYYHMSIDISNFFNSIYTHIISWDLVDEKNKRLFDNFDILNRTLNGNETKGITIGPYTSSLFSEIILSKVDRAILDDCKKNNVNFTRFCDDYDFYSDSKDKLENDVRLTISESLSKYKLDLNMNKMKLEEFPFISLNTIQNKSVFLLMKRIEENDYGDNKLEFIEDIMNEINNSLKIKYSNCNYLLKFIISKIKKGIITKDYFDLDTAEILLDFLINMSFKYNMICSECFNLISEIFNLIDVDRERIILKWIVKRNSRKSHIKEIIDIWLSYLIIKYNVYNNDVDCFMLEIMNKSCVCSILSLEYFLNNNLLKKYKDNIKELLNNIKINLENRFGNDWKKASYFSKYWLLFYTNSIRWKIDRIDGFKDTILKDINLDNIIKDKELSKKYNLFKVMKDKNVEFFSFE